MERQSKAEYRESYLKKRLSLTQAAHSEFSRQLCERFFSFSSLEKIKTLHTFLPAEDRNEPDTWLIIDRLRREFPGVRLAIPKVQGEILEHFYFESLHQLTKTNWGLWEPTHGIPADLMTIDQVLVPLLAADLVGHRLGYGKGFYDRFLAQCKSSCRKTGLSFFPPVERLPDITPGDVRLDDLITPDGYYSFA